MDTILIDTNVLVYAYDANEPTRQTRALGVLHQLGQAALGRLSTQCLGEFASVATRKLRPPLSPSEALRQVELLARAYPVLDLTMPVVLEAARACAITNCPATTPNSGR